MLTVRNLGNKMCQCVDEAMRRSGVLPTLGGVSAVACGRGVFAQRWSTASHDS
jgi:hypothetical protein